MVSSIWQESIVVSVLKKQARGVCELDNFHGVSPSSFCHFSNRFMLVLHVRSKLVAGKVKF